MASNAERFGALIAATLAASQAPELQGLTVYRDRNDAFGTDEPKAIVVEIQDEDTQTMGSGPGAITQDELSVLVLFVARASDWQAQADAMRVAANVALLMQPELARAHLRRGRAQWAAANAELPVSQLGQLYRLAYPSKALTLGPA
jgi:hypothetical protein